MDASKTIEERVQVMDHGEIVRLGFRSQVELYDAVVSGKHVLYPVSRTDDSTAGIKYGSEPTTVGKKDEIEGRRQMTLYQNTSLHARRVRGKHGTQLKLKKN